MTKKICLMFAIIILISNSAYAATPKTLSLTFEEGENTDKAAERLLNGEVVSIKDLYNEPDFSIFENVQITDKIYTQLNTTERALYNGFKNFVQGSKSGSDTILINTPITISTGYDNAAQDDCSLILEEVKAYVSNYLGKNISRAIFGFYSFDYPEFFWVDLNKMGMSCSFNFSTYNEQTGEITIAVKILPGSEYTNYYMDCYTNEAQVESDYNAMQSRIQEIVSTIPENASDFYKIQIINDWLLAHNSYNSNINTGSMYMYLPASALIYGDGDDKTKYPVCEGYAEAFKLLCDAVGIKCICGEANGQKIVNGVAKTAAHKWNLVNIDGKWYYYDATWNDGNDLQGIANKNRFTLIGTNTMKNRDTTLEHELDMMQFGYYLPEVSENDYTKDFSSADYYTLDVNRDNYIDTKDIVTLLRNIMLDNSDVDIDLNGISDIRDNIKYLQLLTK